MADLFLGLALMSALSLAAFRLSAKFAHAISSRDRNVLALTIVGSMFAYIYLVWQSTVLASWLPLSNLIVLGNWFPLFLMALAGVLWNMSQVPQVRRTLGVLLLAIFAGYAAVRPLWGTAPQCGTNYSVDGDCLQTTDFTCTAASAATLLQLHGIPADEQEMAELCLTRQGTNWLGLYRGLKLKTATTPWDVQVVRCSAVDVSSADLPMIIEAGLEPRDNVDAAFRHEFGWIPGAKHSVILKSETSQGRKLVIDPSPHIGREEWDEETLQRLYRGYGMRLVKRH